MELTSNTSEQHLGFFPRALVSAFIGGTIWLAYMVGLSYVLGLSPGGTVLTSIENAVGSPAIGSITLIGMCYVVALIAAILPITAAYAFPAHMIMVTSTGAALLLSCIVYFYALPAVGLRELASAAPAWVSLAGCAVFSWSTASSFVLISRWKAPLIESNDHQEPIREAIYHHGHHETARAH